MYDPNEDGFSHLNVYSQGNTEIGKMLSNFYNCNVITEDGYFSSGEAYYYWLSLPPNSPRESLRTCYGYKAKELGKDLLSKYPRVQVIDFEDKILKYTEEKMKKYSHLLERKYLGIPLAHYYNYKGKIVDRTYTNKWLLDGIKEIMERLLEE